MANKQITNSGNYSVAGRYMSGPEVIAYHLVGEDGTQQKVSRDQLIYLVGRGVIVNLRAQMYGDQLLLRGKNINLNELPVYDEKKGEMRRVEEGPKVKVKDNSGSPLGQMKIIARIKKDTQCIGYMLVDNGGTERKLSRQQVLKLASQGLIGNATVQNNKGTVLLRGVGVDLMKLPVIDADLLKQ